MIVDDELYPFSFIACVTIVHGVCVVHVACVEHARGKLRDVGGMEQAVGAIGSSFARRLLSVNTSVSHRHFLYFDHNTLLCPP